MALPFSARPDAAEVSPGLLIGSAPGPRQRRALVRAGVTVVVDLRAETGEKAGDWPPEVEVVHWPIIDRMAPALPQLRALSDWVGLRISHGHKVFVHCHAGVGRSATVVCGVLVGMGWSLGDAFRALRACRPVAAPTDVQLDVLTELERQLTAARG